MFLSAMYLSNGSELLLEILGPGIVGGLFLRKNEAHREVLKLAIGEKKNLKAHRPAILQVSQPPHLRLPWVHPQSEGKQHAPLIDNPNYKGIWKPQEIPIPDYSVARAILSTRAPSPGDISDHHLVKESGHKKSITALSRSAYGFIVLLSGQEVALKQVYPSRLNHQLRNGFDCELNFLSSVNHPIIVRLFDLFRAEGCIFLVQEFCAGGSLASYLRHHGRVQEQIVRGFMQQLGAAMEIQNSHQIIHRDLKPENILLSVPEDDVVLKISDFGLSRYVHPSNYAETVCGTATALYMAPEVLQFQRYDEKVDMWSLGFTGAPTSILAVLWFNLSTCVMWSGYEMKFWC
ncbi:serine/threonine-protein kinase MARK2-like [Juglans regia]|uniref:Serine/threonine-protein kinase MARK2-like n=1 Tax=Juglans regia TaxID=51240 RepID=A0A6P9E208_JUGRE|nr:serine/threonine-protein kinase MARK2-like [Juglans regia]